MPRAWPWIVGLTFAVLPGVFAWFAGRSVARHIADPLFAERFWAYRKRVSAATVFSLVIIGLSVAFYSAAAALTAAAILTAGLLLATFETRKLLFNETWSFRTFAVFRLRLLVAFAGFWTLLVLSPLIVPAAGRAAWPVAAGILVLLILWSHYYAVAVEWLTGARPIANPALEESLARLADRMQLARPRLLRLGPEGGVLVNAFALPSLRGGRVLFYSTLLDRFTHDEIVAVLAHELAHLEQFNPRILRRHRLAVWFLILMGTLVAPFAAMWTGDSSLPMLLWVVLVLTVMLSLTHGRKERETQGDARAADLIGDPEMLISALTKLHLTGRLPRRWDASTEAQASHPALARRIQALRRQAGRDKRTMAEPVAVPLAETGAFLIFEADRLRHLQDVPSDTPSDIPVLVQQAGRSQAFLYDRIGGVHLEPKGAAADLIIQATATTRVRIALPGPQVSTVQTLLDQIDVGIGAPPPAMAPLLLVRLMAIFLAFVSYVIGAGAATLVQAIVAMAGSSPRSAAALSAAGLVASLLVATTRSVPPLAGALLVIPALLVAWCAIRWRRVTTDDGPRAKYEVAVLAAWVLVTLAALGLNGFNIVRLGQSAADSAAAAVAPVSLAAWLWFAPSGPGRSAQVGVLGALLATIGVALMSTTWFIDAFSRDPLLVTRTGVAAPRFSGSSTELTEAFGPIVIDHPGELRLSPDGITFAVLEWCEDPDSEEGCRRRRVSIGDRDGVHSTFDAIDIRFLDARRLIVMEPDGEKTRLRIDAVSGLPDAWTVTLPLAQADTLAVDSGSGRWAVTSENAGKRIAFTGVAGESQVARHEWAGLADDEEDDMWIRWFLDQSALPLGLATRYSYTDPSGLQSLRRWLLPFYANAFLREESMLIKVADVSRAFERTVLDMECFHAPGRDGIPCFARDGRRTHVWRVDPRAARLQPVGWINAELRAHWPPNGDRWVMSSNACAWRIVDLAAGDVIALPVPSRPCATDVALSATRVAALTRGGPAGAELRVYDMQ